MSWRDSLQPASFRGVSFKVDATSKASGRRGQTFEFPKRDDPSDEDLGRKARRFGVTGWVIGDDYIAEADRLETALIGEGPGQLVLMTMGSLQVRCESYTRTERRVEGGLATFDMTFVEAGSTLASRVAEATQSNVTTKADAAASTTASSADAASTSTAPLPPPKPAPAPEIISV